MHRSVRGYHQYKSTLTLIKIKSHAPTLRKKFAWFPRTQTDQPFSDFWNLDENDFHTDDNPDHTRAPVEQMKSARRDPLVYILWEPERGGGKVRKEKGGMRGGGGRGE